jgi:hypothetical protein
MWGSIPCLEWLASIAFWVGIVTGAIALIAGAALTIANNKIAALTKVDADIRIGESNARAAEAEARAEEAKADAAEANAKAEEAKRDALLLRDKMAWRRVTPAQAESLARSLAGFPHPVKVRTGGDDQEAGLFAHELTEALKSAGLDADTYHGWLYGSPVGLTVVGEDREAVDALARAFEESGVAVQNILHQKIPVDKPLAVLVGRGTGGLELSEDGPTR